MSGKLQAFYVCALVILALELLALGRQPSTGPNTAEIEGYVAQTLQARDQPVSDVRCVRRESGAARCIALMGDGSRLSVGAVVDPATGRLISTVGS